MEPSPTGPNYCHSMNNDRPEDRNEDLEDSFDDSGTFELPDIIQCPPRILPSSQTGHNYVNLIPAHNVMQAPLPNPQVNMPYHHYQYYPYQQQPAQMPAGQYQVLITSTAARYQTPQRLGPIRVGRTHNMDNIHGQQQVELPSLQHQGQVPVRQPTVYTPVRPRRMLLRRQPRGQAPAGQNQPQMPPGRYPRRVLGGQPQDQIPIGPYQGRPIWPPQVIHQNQTGAAGRYGHQ
uniref:Leucine-rich repeat extensin-like protein 2 n=1 Tax=Steinernema glaseri TaxID=37863 RepID=A0A1I8A4I9_9BILA